MRKRQFFVNEIFEDETKETRIVETLKPKKVRTKMKVKVKRKFSKKLLLIPLFIVLAIVFFTRF